MINQSTRMKTDNVNLHWIKIPSTSAAIQLTLFERGPPRDGIPLCRTYSASIMPTFSLRRPWCQAMVVHNYVRFEHKMFSQSHIQPNIPDMKNHNKALKTHSRIRNSSREFAFIPVSNNQLWSRYPTHEPNHSAQAQPSEKHFIGKQYNFSNTRNKLSSKIPSSVEGNH